MSELYIDQPVSFQPSLVLSLTGYYDGKVVGFTRNKAIIEITGDWGGQHRRGKTVKVHPSKVFPFDKKYHPAQWYAGSSEAPPLNLGADFKEKFEAMKPILDYEIEQRAKARRAEQVEAHKLKEERDRKTLEDYKASLERDKA